MNINVLGNDLNHCDLMLFTFISYSYITRRGDLNEAGIVVNVGCYPEWRIHLHHPLPPVC